MLGAAVIVVVLVVVLPVAFALGGAILAALLGSTLDRHDSGAPSSGRAGRSS